MFSKTNRGRGPSAQLTLLALKWVCLKRNVDIVVPDWEALRYRVLRNLKNSRRTFADGLNDLAARLSIKTPALRSYCYGPWEMHSRMPKGNITLCLLADQLKTPEHREDYYWFLGHELNQYPYKSLPTDEALTLKKRHDSLTAEAIRLMESPACIKANLPDWLEKII
jgi:hypothetical protein